MGAQAKKNEMGGPCSMYEGVERCIQGFGMKSDGQRTLGRLRHRHSGVPWGRGVWGVQTP